MNQCSSAQPDGDKLLLHLKWYKRHSQFFTLRLNVFTSFDPKQSTLLFVIVEYYASPYLLLSDSYVMFSY